MLPLIWRGIIRLENWPTAPGHFLSIIYWGEIMPSLSLQIPAMETFRFITFQFLPSRYLPSPITLNSDGTAKIPFILFYGVNTPPELP